MTSEERWKRRHRRSRFLAVFMVLCAFAAIVFMLMRVVAPDRLRKYVSLVSYLATSKNPSLRLSSDAIVRDGNFVGYTRLRVPTHSIHSTLGKLVANGPDLQITFHHYMAIPGNALVIQIVTADPIAGKVLDRKEAYLGSHLIIIPLSGNQGGRIVAGAQNAVGITTMDYPFVEGMPMTYLASTASQGFQALRSTRLWPAEGNTEWILQDTWSSSTYLISSIDGTQIELGVSNRANAYPARTEDGGQVLLLPLEGWPGLYDGQGVLLRLFAPPAGMEHAIAHTVMNPESGAREILWLHHQEIAFMDMHGNVRERASRDSIEAFAQSLEAQPLISYIQHPLTQFTTEDGRPLGYAVYCGGGSLRFFDKSFRRVDEWTIPAVDDWDLGFSTDQKLPNQLLISLMGNDDMGTSAWLATWPQ